MKSQFFRKFSQINENLPVLLAGEAIFLAAAELIILMWIPKDLKRTAGIGVLIGVLLAAAGSVILALSIRSALYKEGNKAWAVLFITLRFGVAALVLLLCLVKDPKLCVAVLIGMLSGQTGVYLAPAAARFRNRKEKKNVQKR
ncbi:MAG: hypothetical protein ACOX78_03420 [Lachnospiraceae bacterium]|jgi:uncharacterized membrane protein